MRHIRGVNRENPLKYRQSADQRAPMTRARLLPPRLGPRPLAVLPVPEAAEENPTAMSACMEPLSKDTLPETDILFDSTPAGRSVELDPDPSRSSTASTPMATKPTS